MSPCPGLPGAAATATSSRGDPPNDHGGWLSDSSHQDLKGLNRTRNWSLTVCAAQSLWNITIDCSMSRLKLIGLVAERKLEQCTTEN
jgi:hypothetical protein